MANKVTKQDRMGLVSCTFAHKNGEEYSPNTGGTALQDAFHCRYPNAKEFTRHSIHSEQLNSWLYSGDGLIESTCHNRAPYKGHKYLLSNVSHT